MTRLVVNSQHRRWILAGTGLTLVLVSLLLLLRHSLYRPLSAIEQPEVFEVIAGSSFSRVSAELSEREIIPSPVLFRLLARWQGVTNAIQAGEYELQPGMSAVDLLDLMVSGKAVQYRITLVEGWTFTQALEEIAKKVTLTHTLTGADPGDIAKALDVEQDNPEGLIHPDTYFFTRGTTDLEILQRARTRQEEILSRAWEQRLGALPYASPYEALIMASIIEKESGVASEKGHIAGVFIRRLERGMRLQSDPTVIYGMGEDYQGNISRTDLTTTTAYNTYRINGLPPTPIALAGEESIIASLNPLTSDFLYFVATGDGGHYFSASLEEHNAAVSRYQLTDGSNDQN